MSGNAFNIINNFIGDSDFRSITILASCKTEEVYISEVKIIVLKDNDYVKLSTMWEESPCFLEDFSSKKLYGYYQSNYYDFNIENNELILTEIENNNNKLKFSLRKLF